MDGINNYKGVMLCSRPNEVLQFLKEKPFCSRVDPKGQLGLCPVKQEKQWEIQPKQRVNEALSRHKEWLEVFKLKMKLKKEMTDDEYKQQEEKQQKIKELAAKNRERTKKMKDEFQKLNQSILLELDDEKAAKNISNKGKNLPLTENNLKKLENQYNDLEEQKKNQESPQKEQPNKQSKKKKSEKPKWALTEKEQQDAEEQEVDNLLNFVDNLDYDKYIDDLEVNTMIKAIKNRVDELKKQDNWKENMAKRYQVKENQNQDNDNDNQDNVSNAGSQVSQTKSVMSERTQESIKSLKEKMEEKKKGKSEWDKSTTGKNQPVNLEDRIAKLVADEVLRNYKNLSGVHSNQSIRKILEKEARSHLIHNQENEKYQGPNITIVKERTLRKDELDPNNLPYMHRNPAI